MATKHVKYLIAGGGVSGLMFANQVGSNEYLILEREDELGGYCRTIYQDGFVWDYAGHFFHFANEVTKAFFESKVSPDSLVTIKKSTKIFFKDRIVDFPFQANIHQLGRKDFLDCLYDLYFRPEKEEHTSFLDMLYGKFGSSITEMFLKPYNEKLYACDLDTLDVDAMGRFFPKADFGQVIRNFKQDYQGSYNATFTYPKLGARVFVDALATDLDREKISCNEEVLAINAAEKIVTTNRREISYEHMISSMPLSRLLDMISDVDYTAFRNKLSWNKVLVFNLGFDRLSKYDDIHWAYFPEREYNFYRVGFYSTILSQDRLSLYVEIGFSADEPIDVSEQLKASLSGLRKAGIIESHRLVSSCHIVMDPAYVHVDSSLAQNKVEIMAALEQRGIHSIGRYGDWKYCSIEDSIMDAVRLSKKLSNN